MAQFHSAEEFERHVEALVAAYPLDEAMALAVGGSFNEVGDIEADLLETAGLRDGMHLVDLGCGSGRLASALHRRDFYISYTGVDVVERLLAYARTITPLSYTFVRAQEPTVPGDAGSADMISAFSLFTHLLHQETYLYLEDGFRVLKPGGLFVFSFLEFDQPAHWHAFHTTVEQSRSSATPHLNSFCDRGAIHAWAQHIGYEVATFDPKLPSEPPSALGQSIAVLRKPGQG